MKIKIPNKLKTHLTNDNITIDLARASLRNKFGRFSPVNQSEKFKTIMKQAVDEILVELRAKHFPKTN
jgi:hypothetical protein